MTDYGQLKTDDDRQWVITIAHPELCSGELIKHLYFSAKKSALAGAMCLPERRTRIIGSMMMML